MAEIDTLLYEGKDAYGEKGTLDQDVTQADRGSRVIVSGAAAETLWGRLVELARQLENEFPYVVGATEPINTAPATNSNSFIGSILYHDGIMSLDYRPSGIGVAPGEFTLLGATAMMNCKLLDQGAFWSVAVEMTF